MPVYYLDGVVLIGLGERVLFMVFIFYFFGCASRLVGF